MTTNPDLKTLALDHVHRISTGDIAGAAAHLADDYVNHGALPGSQGRDGFVTIMKKIRTAFPDFTHVVEDTLVDGDRVMVRVTFKGTHTGPMTFVNLELPPTSKAVAFEQIHVLRIARGKIAEHWMTQDSLAMLRQLGLKIVPA